MGRGPERIGGGDQHGHAGGREEAGEAAGQAPDLVLGAGEGGGEMEGEDRFFFAGRAAAFVFTDAERAGAKGLAEVACAGDGDLREHGGMGGVAGADLAFDGGVGFGGHGGGDGRRL